MKRRKTVRFQCGDVLIVYLVEILYNDDGKLVDKLKEEWWADRQFFSVVTEPLLRSTFETTTELRPPYGMTLWVKRFVESGDFPEIITSTYPKHPYSVLATAQRPQWMWDFVVEIHNIYCAAKPSGKEAGDRHGWYRVQVDHSGTETE